MARNILGVLGVLAAGVLLAVSAAMNYRFGFSLGKTAADGQIYGAASAAADCFKALVPFFFFAALRNRMWSQACAAALVWVVVTGYSMTSALGHAAMNRLDMSGQRTVATAKYQDLRADNKRAQDQLNWIPAHRPPDTVASELNVHKAQRHWLLTRECTDVKGKTAREYCQQYHKLSAELASGRESQKLEVRIAEIGGKIAKAASGSVVMAEADPQASVLARLAGVEVETVQSALTIFVALLIEIGSGLGLYVAFAYWRTYTPMHGGAAPAVAAATEATAAAVGTDQSATLRLPAPEAELDADGATQGAQPPSAARLGANDNASRAALMPPSDVELFYREAVVAEQGVLTCSQDMFEGYRAWSKIRDKRPLHMSRFSMDFEGLGHKTVEVGGRKRYSGIALTFEVAALLPERKASRRRKAQDIEALPAPDQTRAA